MRNLRLVAVVVLAALLAACSSEGSSPPAAHRVLDEDGVRVVESTRPAWAAPAAWTVDPLPRVEIGGAEGAEHDMLGEPHGTRFLPDGRIIVTDGSTNDLRVFDASGSFVAAVGRSGSGPCEFSMIGEPWPAADGTVAIIDMKSRGRMTLLADDGACVDTRPIQLADYRGFDIVGRLADGSLILTAGSHVPDGPAAGADSGWNDTSLLRVVWGQEPQLLARVRAVEGFEGDLRFASHAAFAVAGDHLYSTDGERYEIDVRDASGAVVRRMRLTELPAAVTDADIERFRERSRDNIRAAGNPDGELERLDRTRFAPRFPAYRRLRVDDAGRVWAQRYRGLSEELPFVYPGRPFGEQMFPPADHVDWDVFHADGYWLGTVELPPDRALADVLGDAVLTEGMDADGVFHVWVHALSRG